MKSIKLLLLFYFTFSCFVAKSQVEISSDSTSFWGYPVLEFELNEKLTFQGEVGVRTELILNERFARSSETQRDTYRFRERVRLRFGAEYHPKEWFTAGFRFSTGQATYPASGWSSFSDDFNRDPVFLDRVYCNFTYENFQLRLGSNSNPLFRPTELVWDGDVQVSGIAEVFKLNRWEIITGQFMLVETRDLFPEKVSGSTLFAHGINYDIQKDGSFKIGIFQYYYNKPDAIAVAIENGTLDADFKTNRISPTDSTSFFSNYNSVGASFYWKKKNWRIVAETVVNLAAKKDASLGKAYADKENVGAGFLLRYGNLKRKKGWNAEIGYFYIESDATIAAFNSDDLQQTNVHSIPIWFRYKLLGNTLIVWDTYLQKRINTFEELFVSGGVQHTENAWKLRSRITLQVGF